jgi:hypothetical protein
MTTLDMLARDSARAVHASVAFVPVPVRGIVSTTRWFYFRRSVGYALAGSAAAILAVVALMVVSTPSDEVTDVTSPTVTTVAPPTTATQNTVGTVPPTTIPSESLQPPTPVVVPPAADSTPSADTVAPRIQILSPDAESRVKTASVIVVGLTEPGAKVTYPNDRVIDVADDGMWSTEVRLDAGENVLSFTATDEAGNQATASVTVFRVVDPPRPTTTTTTTKPTDTTTTTSKAPVEWVFAAHSTYGSCSENPAYDVYYGTGKPGTQIIISSEYGGGMTEVAENGEWSLKVFFPEAPQELTFPVKVKDFTGERVVFEFVNLFVG